MKSKENQIKRAFEKWAYTDKRCQFFARKFIDRPWEFPRSKDYKRHLYWIRQATKLENNIVRRYGILHSDKRFYV